jgi:hypothetical protein
MTTYRSSEGNAFLSIELWLEFSGHLALLPLCLLWNEVLKCWQGPGTHLYGMMMRENLSAILDVELR